MCLDRLKMRRHERKVRNGCHHFFCVTLLMVLTLLRVHYLFPSKVSASPSLPLLFSKSKFLLDEKRRGIIKSADKLGSVIDSIIISRSSGSASARNSIHARLVVGSPSCCRGGDSTSHYDDPSLQNVPPTTYIDPYGFALSSSPQSSLASIRDSNNRRMPAISIRLVPSPATTDGSSEVKNGPMIVEVQHITVTKLELSQQLGCPLRDLRIIDQKFATTFGSSLTSSSRANVASGSGSSYVSSSAGAGYGTNTAFLPRKSGIIVHIAGHTRAIVMKKNVLLFVPEYAAKDYSAHRDDPFHDHHNVIQLIVDHLTYVYGGNSSGVVNKDSNIENGGNQAGLIQQSEHQHQQREKSDHIDNARNATYHRQHPPSYPSVVKSSATPIFELVVLEALLGYVYIQESKKASEMIERAKNVLEGITVSPVSTATNPAEERKRPAWGSGDKKDSFMVMQAKLGQLLPLKNRLDALEAHCAEVAAAIHDILQNDEDMQAMYLSRQQSEEENEEGVGQSSRTVDRKTVATQCCQQQQGAGGKSGSAIKSQSRPFDHDHVEVELLFEDFLLQIEEVLYSLRAVQSSVTNTEEVVEIELDLMRNVIMRYNLLLELSSFAVGCAAAITGLFGMNLLNRMELHPRMFYYLTFALVLLIFVIAFGIREQLRIDHIW